MDESGLHFERSTPCDGCPLCFLHGFMGSTGDWAPIRDALPNARRVVVPDAGHNGHAERPQAFVSHLGQYLRETKSVPETATSDPL